MNAKRVYMLTHGDIVCGDEPGYPLTAMRVHAVAWSPEKTDPALGLFGAPAVTEITWVDPDARSDGPGVTFIRSTHDATERFTVLGNERNDGKRGGYFGYKPGLVAGELSRV